MPSASPNIFDKCKDKAHRGEGDPLIKDLSFVTLKPKEFKEGVSWVNVFFSSTPADELYKILLEYGEK